ncbi:MAG: polysaccharide biosynthesis tyrosine autokinase [Candidatus Omnitrophota bacterium]|jgi:capsular exopolysaccharide synthesis family protein
MGKKRFIAPVLLGILSLVILADIKQKPVYRASATVIIGVVIPDDFSYRTYVETQREIIKSRRTAHHVIKNLGLKEDTDSLLRKVKTQSIKGTEIIRIVAEDAEAENARRIANEFARVYINPALSRIKTDNARVQDFADVPYAPAEAGKRSRMIASAMLMAVAGASAVFFRKGRGKAIKDPTDITGALKLPVLGCVPKIRPDGKNIRAKTDADMVVKKDPLCMGSEAYRSVRAKLFTAKSIIITSSAPREGKTISAINLAVMIAHGGESVLLVDTHVKRPRIHAVFNMNNDAGFSNYISGEADFGDIIKYPGIDNLSIITSGAGSYRPVESISSKNIKLFLEKAGTGFSKIIFDAPAAPFLGDMAVLLNICDATVLVAENKRTTKELLNNSKELLRKRGANIIGIILNNVSF